MSSCAPTVVTTGGVVLFVGFGSGVPLPPVAMLVTLTPFAGAVTFKLRFVIASYARLLRLPHLPSFPTRRSSDLALTKLTPAGKESVTVTLLAVDGPKFVTLIV